MNSCHTTLKASYFYASAFMAVAVGNIFLPIWINNLGIVKTINLGLFVQMVALYGVLFSLSSSDPPPQQPTRRTVRSDGGIVCSARSFNKPLQLILLLGIMMLLRLKPGHACDLIPCLSGVSRF